MTTEDIIWRWVYKQVHNDRHKRYLKGSGIKLICQRGVIYSRDRSFPLAMCLYRRKKVFCILLNGDMGTRTNRRHQDSMRWVMRNRFQYMQCIIVPFSALEAASIDKETIRPIEIREDRFGHITHRVAPWDKTKIKWRDQGPSFGGLWWQRGTIEGRTDLRFSRRISQRWGIDEDFFDVRSQTGERISTDSGGYYWIERRHWLGDSVFRAKVNGRYRTFVSSFDYQEPVPLYFLAEVPSGALVESVDDAMLALSPPIVHAAVAQKRDVKRQGDMFAIPTNLTTEDVLARTRGGIQKNEGVFGTDHVASEVAVGKKRVTYARGAVHHKPEGRRRDHEPCNLGETWHLMVPNAVPRRRRGMQVRAGRT